MHLYVRLTRDQLSWLVFFLNINLSQVKVILEEGISIEKTLLPNWPVGKPVVRLLDSGLMWVSLSRAPGATSGSVVLDGRRDQAEGAIGNKPVSSTLHRLSFSSCVQAPAPATLDDGLQTVG